MSVEARPDAVHLHLLSGDPIARMCLLGRPRDRLVSVTAFVKVSLVGWLRSVFLEALFQHHAASQYGQMLHTNMDSAVITSVGTCAFPRRS